MAQLADTTLISDANLKAYWKLEDTADSEASYTLTNNNTVTFTTAKYLNGANLGTSNTNKSLSVNSDLTITGGAMSISMWVKILTEITTGSYCLIDHSDAGNLVQTMIIYEYNAGTPRLRFDRTKRGVSNNPIYHNITLGETNFHHVCLTYDTTNLVAYYNGEAVGSPLATSGNGSTGGSSDMVNIGRTQGNAGTFASYASALIDDVAVFNDALTADEVRTIYRDGSGFFLFF